jgi:hypothetical protein
VDARDPQRVAWLFTREEESVRVELDRGPTGPRLVIRGPGLAKATYDFKDAASLAQFQASHQEELIARGFRLQAFADRRGGDRRSGASRASKDRRKP